MMSKRMRLSDTVLGVGMAAALFTSSCHAMSCDNIDSRAVEMRWAKTSNRIYLSSGCATIADVLAFRSDTNGAKGPLFHFDWETNTVSPTYTGVYYLEASLFVTNNATLSIDGTNSDFQPCKTLLLASNSSTYQNIRAHGGNLKITNTQIFSWDLDAGYYDMIHGDGRSYLSAITEKITGRTKDKCPGLPETDKLSNGRAKLHMGNARMDIINSEIGYLGFNASESYGVSFKARGLCKDVSNSDIFDDNNGFDVAVRGDILNSRIHHCWFGHYSFGHQDGRWNYNEVHDNYGYGFDPHDDSDKIEMIGNTVYNNGWHGMIASKRCTDLLFKDNVVFNNGMHGIMLHRSCDRANITGNEVFENGESGIAIFETWDTLITNNTITGNKYGVRLSNGAVNNVVTGNKINVIDSSDVYAVFMYKGSDPPEVSNGRPSNNKIRNNEIHTTHEVIFKVSNADGNIITDNVIVGGSRVIFVDATDTMIRRNTFTSPTTTYASEDSCFRQGSATGPVCE